MRAAIVREHGGPDRLEVVADWPEPEVGESDVLVRVRAASLNYHDVFTRRGMPGIKLKLPVVPGLDLAGEVVRLGQGVSEVAEGDRVLVDPLNRVEGGLMGETVDGGLQEFARARAHQCVPIPNGVSFEDAAALPVAMVEQHVTMITGVPTMMRLLLDEPGFAELAPRARLRAISMGSSPASGRLLADLGRAFPEAEIHLDYGVTEGGPIMFGWYHPDGRPRPPHSIGWPIPGCEWRLEGASGPDEGELWVRNPGVALGYHERPDASAARFADGWFRSGDVLRRDALGWFYFVGRVDDMFVSGGENVFPQEVEALLERHPAIRQAAVLPVRHEVKGAVPVAFVVAEGSQPVDEAEVRRFAIRHGPAYAHPRRVLALDRLPLTGTNKVDKAALRAILPEGADEEARPWASRKGWTARRCRHASAKHRSTSGWASRCSRPARTGSP